MSNIYRGYFAILYVKDIERSRNFYETQVGFKFDKGDERSAGLFVGDDFLLLLNYAGADEMLTTDDVDHGPAGRARGVLVAPVEDVDKAYEELRLRGVQFIRPPEDRSWGVRCAYFRDPDGHVWEIH